MKRQHILILIEYALVHHPKNSLITGKCLIQVIFELENCEDDEVFCPGTRNPINGCYSKDKCEPKNTHQWGETPGSDCPGWCPAICLEHEILCPSMVDPCNGCPTEEICEKPSRMWMVSSAQEKNTLYSLKVKIIEKMETDEADSYLHLITAQYTVKNGREKSNAQYMKMS